MDEKQGDSKVLPSEWLSSNKKGGFLKILAIFISSWCITIWLLHTFCAYFSPPEAISFRTIHVTLFLIAAFLFYPLKRKSWDEAFNWSFLIDCLFILLVIIIQVYMFLDFDAFQMRSGIDPTNLDILFGCIMIFLILEATRRTVGWPLVGLSIAFIIYSISAENFPGILNAPQLSLSTFIDFVFIGGGGIYGIAIYVMSTFIIMFIFFGAFLFETGAGEFFVNLAYAIAGKRIGGPAKVAVVSSAFMGTMSGSVVANVVTTGTFTIPLMKRVGFPSTIAGAIEAVSSTGGAITPPVMGAVAFVMAFYLNVSYGFVCLAAILPALLYYLSLFFMIHFEAKKRGLKPTFLDEAPSTMSILKKGVQNLLPILVIIFFLILGYSPMIVGFAGIISVFIVGFRTKATMITHRKLIRAMENGVKSSIMVSVACAAVGIIITAVGQTGFGARITSIIIDLSGGTLLVLLLLTMILTIMLGMGLTPIVLYISLVSTVVPALIIMGISPIAAHFFVMYYGVVSNIVPPVAFAAYAAAGVAGSNIMKTGFMAMKYGLAGIFMPFLFVYKPELLFQGSLTSIVWISFTSVIAVVCLAAAFQGWFLTRINVLSKVLLFLIFMLLVKKGWIYDMTGLALFAILLLIDRNILISKFRNNLNKIQTKLIKLF
jgi:TRAP transporter 4TM/12TM fusion protein